MKTYSGTRITPTSHERAEWYRCLSTLPKTSESYMRIAAALAYDAGRSMPVGIFDAASSVYRSWLVFNRPEDGL